MCKRKEMFNKINKFARYYYFIIYTIVNHSICESTAFLKKKMDMRPKNNSTTV